MKNNIILIGFMGTGKTTIGGLLAKKINYSFVDVDEAIVQSKGMTIPDIFARYGEKYFREIEKEYIRKILDKQSMVIATGGGAVMDPENMSIMMEKGWVIALDASLNTLWGRLKDCSNRPMLFHDNPRKRMEELYNLRKPAYYKAHHVITVDCKTSQEIVNEIIRYLVERESKCLETSK